jgi:GT2 family glycosyltransferase
MYRTLVGSARATLIGVSYEIICVDNFGKPQGFTAPFNAAIRAARGEYIVATNDDVQFLDGWFPPLKRELDAGADVAIPYTEDHQRHGWWCIAMRRELVAEMSVEPGEFWDRQFVLWYSDGDFLKRLERDGRRVAYVKDSRILHRETASHDPSDPATAARIAEDAAEFQRKWEQ